MSAASLVYLLDTNSIIEAVRVGVWNAISGGLNIETVEECAEECRRGDTLSTGYIKVSDSDLERMSAIRSVAESDRAALLLQADASALDRGELDLYAHAASRGQTNWLVCSPDHASVKIGVTLGWQDRLVSLEELADLVGARPSPALRKHFMKSWLSHERTKALLGM